jgi:hypothetical protein
MAADPDIAPQEASLAVRVHAPAEPPSVGHNRPGFDRVCRECGDDTRVAERHGAFCCNTCRASWNNRRKARGAEIYDLIMALRYERGLAKGLKIWTAICRLAMVFRQEDLRERAGRHSWRAPKAVLDERPFLKATVLDGGTRKAAPKPEAKA